MKNLNYLYNFKNPIRHFFNLDSIKFDNSETLKFSDLCWTTYVVGYVDQFDCIDSLVLYNDGTIELTQTHISCGKQTDPETHQVIAATVYAADSIVTTGTYTIDEKADGYQKVNLAAADRVIFNRVVMSGMFVKGIDSELSTFPVTYIGDDVTQISREQFMSDYGSAKTYYIVLDGNEEPTTQIVHEIG